MKLFNKYLHLIIMMAIAAIMVFGLSVTVFASDADPYITYLDQTDLRNAYNVSDITDDTTLTLRATTANVFWAATEFDSDTEADRVNWTSSNTNLVELLSHGHEDAPNNGYYSNATFKIKGNGGTGSCTIQATRPNGQHVNFTVVIENPYYSDLASNVTVSVFDATGNYPDFVAEKALSTVTLPTQGDILYPYTNRAQTFSTPVYALANMVSSTAPFNYDLGYADYIRTFSLSSWGIYVNSIKTDCLNGSNVTEETLTAIDGTYVGWNYRVMRNGIIVPESKVIEAADFKLQSGDAVYWVYGTPQDVDNFFN